MGLAREAHKRVKGRVLLPPRYYRPSLGSWMVLFALERSDGTLPSGDVTVVGAHVDARYVKPLRRCGLVVVEDGMVTLTPDGWRRVQRRW